MGFRRVGGYMSEDIVDVSERTPFVAEGATYLLLLTGGMLAAGLSLLFFLIGAIRYLPDSQYFPASVLSCAAAAATVLLCYACNDALVTRRGWMVHAGAACLLASRWEPFGLVRGFRACRQPRVRLGASFPALGPPSGFAVTSHVGHRHVPHNAGQGGGRLHAAGRAERRPSLGARTPALPGVGRLLRRGQKGRHLRRRFATHVGGVEAERGHSQDELRAGALGRARRGHGGVAALDACGPVAYASLPWGSP